MKTRRRLAVRAFTVAVATVVAVLTSCELAGAQEITSLHSFNASIDGAGAFAPLVQASDGNFYGTTYYGGALGSGTVFKMTPAGTVTVLRAFGESSTDGGGPVAGLVEASDGNLYGTTMFGGTADSGTVFKITPGGAFTLLHSFVGGSDGAVPRSAVIEGDDGNFYGTTSAGGDSDLGTVFRMTPAGVVTILHAFTGSADGGRPYSRLLKRSDGAFLGTAQSGSENSGAVFRVTPIGDFSVLHAFDSGAADGIDPQNALIATNGGDFYGTTVSGGAWGLGTVFKMTADGTVILVYSFEVDDGLVPSGDAGLIEAADGNIYGMASQGGVASHGTIFRLSPAGVFSVAAAFINITQGGYPYGGLTKDADGSLYGTTSWGGAFSNGTVFRFDIKAAITSPAPGSALSGTSVAFSWSSGIAASSYWLEVGTAAGRHDFFGQSVGLATSQTVSGLPMIGNTIYVRLWSQVGASWLFNDYTYIALNGKAVMTSPTPGSMLTGASVTFNWTAGTGASAYYLEVGTAAGQHNLFGQSEGLATSQLVSGLPILGNAIYVRLWTQLNGSWQFNDYTYTGLNGKAVMTSPAPGSALSGASVTFNWTAGTGASAYYLEAGTAVGQHNLFGQSVGLATSQIVSGLPIVGSALYVRLWTQINSSWQFNDYTYTAFNGKAVMISPAPGSALNVATMIFTWSAGAGASAYYLEAGTTLGQSNLFGQNVGLATSHIVGGGILGNTIYVRLWTQLNGSWLFNDYTYTAFDARASMTSPAPGSILPGPNASFFWSLPVGAPAYVWAHWLDVGTAPGRSDLLSHYEGIAMSDVLIGLPASGSTIYVRLWTQYYSGIWVYNDYTYQVGTP